MMATSAPVKRETLKNIGNVPDWVLKQQTSKDSKKDTPKAVRPRPTTKQPTKAKASTHAPVVVAPVAPVVTVPIKTEVKTTLENAAPTPGSKVKRIYSREFLIKFKYTAPTFPPGALTPLDLIAQYNKEFEIKERLSTMDNSSLTSVKPTPTPSVPTPAPTPASSATPTPVEKKLKKKKEGEKAEGTPKRGGEKTPFKLRLGTTDEAILRSPLFRAAGASSKAPARHATPPVIAPFEDKENSGSTLKTASRATSITKARAPSPKVKEVIKPTKIPTTPAPTLAPTPAPTPVAAPAPVSIPTPTPVAVITPPVAQPAADAVMEDSKDEVVDVLTKKLKAVLKETDARRLAQRQKQIDYGKATAGYQDYMKEIAKSKRKREDPKTPNKYQVCSKRSWDGQVRKWRRMLHMYDPAELKDQVLPELDEKHFVITEADLLAEENALRE